MPDPGALHLVPYNTTPRARPRLALGIPMYAADPRHFPLGTKSGAGASSPRPASRIRSALRTCHTVATRCARSTLLRAPTGDRGAIVKLDEGVAGAGNALVDLRDLPGRGARTRRPSCEPRARDELEDGTVRRGLPRHLAEGGGIVEERIAARGAQPERAAARHARSARSRSCRPTTRSSAGRVASLPRMPVPGRPGLRRPSRRRPTRSGERLAARGGHRSVRARLRRRARRGGDLEAYAIEVNLRKGGTTHPFLTLQFLTDGAYDPDACSFTAPSGQAKHLVASDELKSPALRGFVLDDLFDTIVRHQLCSSIAGARPAWCSTCSVRSPSSAASG